METLRPLLDSVSTLIAPWLDHAPQQQFLPTHIKQIRTSAPQDMKSAKEYRTAGKQSAKKRRLIMKLSVENGYSELRK